jgi:hypothetical protein
MEHGGTDEYSERIQSNQNRFFTGQRRVDELTNVKLDDVQTENKRRIADIKTVAGLSEN